MPLDLEHQRALLRAARNAIGVHLGIAPIRVDALEQAPDLTRSAGAFVSLYRLGELRGCVGTMFVERPLAEVVRRMAVAAATEDPRFGSLRVEELAALTVQISVLSPGQPARPEDVVVGRHGLLVRRGTTRGVLLPQVAVEHSWSAVELLAQTCRKAGLHPDSWRDPDTSLETFEAEVFGDA